MKVERLYIAKYEQRVSVNEIPLLLRDHIERVGITIFPVTRS